jgi:hypothetical protein
MIKMTVKEMFENKYRERMATITEREWKRAKEDAECRNMPVAEFIMLCLEITEKEMNANGLWYSGCELESLNKQKIIASNRHKSDCRNPAKFWLTKKGYKQLFA